MQSLQAVERFDAERFIFLVSVSSDSIETKLNLYTAPRRSQRYWGGQIGYRIDDL